MKKALIVLVVSLFALSGQASAAGEASANNPQEKESISSIRERYAAVNKNLAKYRMVKKELAGFSTEGGELVAYFDGASVVKIAATHLGETGRSFEEFYYRDGELIFVFYRRETYDAPMSGKVSKTAEPAQAAFAAWAASEPAEVLFPTREFADAAYELKLEPEKAARLIPEINRHAFFSHYQARVDPSYNPWSY
jgi:hypothetical protein